MIKHQLHCQSIRIKFLLFTVLTVLGLGCGQKVFFVAEYSAFEYSETKGSRTTTDPHCIIGGADSFYIVYPVHYQLEVFDTVSSHDPEVPTLDTTAFGHFETYNIFVASKNGGYFANGIFVDDETPNVGLKQEVIVIKDE